PNRQCSRCLPSEYESEHWNGSTLPDIDPATLDRSSLQESHRSALASGRPLLLLPRRNQRHTAITARRRAGCARERTYQLPAERRTTYSSRCHSATPHTQDRGYPTQEVEHCPPR